MSQPTPETTDPPEGQTGTRRFEGPGRVPPSVQATLGSIALAPVAATTALRVLRNAPAPLPEWLGATLSAVSTLSAIAPALALAGLGAVADRRAERVALLAAGVFPLLAAFGDPAWLPAAAALVAGGGTAVALTLQRRGFPPAPTAVAALGGGALACSLAGVAGVAPVALRSLGATLAFAALAALPVARSLDTAGLLAWVIGTLAVVWLVASAPFVAGAVTLVAFAAGDVPAVLLAGGVAGALVVALAAGWRRNLGVAVGALLLLAAGAPAGLARGTAVVLGLVVLVATWDGVASETPEAIDRSAAGGRPVADTAGFDGSAESGGEDGA